MPRYSDAQILAELAACARRLGRSPTMREFSGDPSVHMHPQTVVERFGTWNEAKRRAGLVLAPLRDEGELLAQLRALGDELGRHPTGRDLDERRARLPSKSLYWHRFGSLSNALRAAGFAVPRRDERGAGPGGGGAPLAPAGAPAAVCRLEAARTGAARGCCPSGRCTGSSRTATGAGRPSGRRSAPVWRDAGAGRPGRPPREAEA